MFNANKSETPKVSLLEFRKRTIFITPEAFEKMSIIVQEGGSDEVGWLGTVKQFENGDFLIDGIFIPKQGVHSTTTEISEEGLADLAIELMQEDGGPQRVNRLRFWGHSHVNMGVSPSGQDNTQMAKLSEDCDDFFIRAIANKKGEIDFTIYLYEENLQIDHAEWQIYYELPTDFREQIKEELKDKVSKITYASTYGSHVYGSSYYKNKYAGNSYYGHNQGQKKSGVNEAEKKEEEENDNPLAGTQHNWTGDWDEYDGYGF